MSESQSAKPSGAIDVPRHIETLCAAGSMSRDESQALFAAVMRGELDAISLTAILIALKAKGETPDEIAGAATAMREAALTLDTGDLDVIDSCGTGGDGAQTVNISTATAIVAAAGGAHVAKHGNRSISSRCGSADVLEQCGIDIEATPAASRQCLDKAGICFLFAPQYHAGVRHAMGVRRGLGVRTMFNLLGPLANPALPRFQLVGVYDPARCRALAETLGLLGCERALVVHGGGLDEIALHAPTTAALLEAGEVRELTLSPADVGLASCSIDELRGGAPEENARWLTQLLAGHGTRAHNHAVAINAGAVLWLCGKAVDHRAGVEAALELLASGAGATTMDRWKAAQAEAAALA
jgi:anthranilate phosphoribosyltransferase